jgi:hypothetical protein
MLSETPQWRASAALLLHAQRASMLSLLSKSSALLSTEFFKVKLFY